MSERSFDDEGVYYIEGDANKTTMYRTLSGHASCVECDTPIDEIADEYKISTATMPNGLIFGINFSKVDKIEQTEVTETDLGPMMTLPIPIEKKESFHIIHMGNEAPIDGGTTVVFKDNYVLTLPVSVGEVKRFQMMVLSANSQPQNPNYKTIPPAPIL